MADQRYTIKNDQGEETIVILRRDKRLKKTSRWELMPDGSLLVRVPQRLPRSSVSELLKMVTTQLDKLNKHRAKRTDVILQQRAEQLNRKLFHGKMQWNAIRWVGNMETRLGSCTGGGPTDGEIRISDKIKDWPLWVLDYVIAHEMMHRRHPNHSDAFWDELKSAYPLTDKAIGFIQGVYFARRQDLDEYQTF